MICPSCKKQNSCGCKSCRSYSCTPEFERTILEGNNITCGYCGFTSNCDIWLDYNYSLDENTSNDLRQYKSSNRISN